MKISELLKAQPSLDLDINSEKFIQKSENNL